MKPPSFRTSRVPWMWLSACMLLAGCVEDRNSSANAPLEGLGPPIATQANRLAPSLATNDEGCFRLRVVPEFNGPPVVLDVEDELGVYHAPYDHDSGMFRVPRLVPLREPGDQVTDAIENCRSGSPFRVTLPMHDSLVMHFTILPGELRSRFDVPVSVSEYPCTRSSVETLDALGENSSLAVSVDRYLAARRLYFVCREELNEGHIVMQRALRNWFDAAAQLVLDPTWGVFGRDMDVEKIIRGHLSSEEPPRHFSVVNPNEGYLVVMLDHLETVVWRHFGNIEQLRRQGRADEASALHEYFLNLYDGYDERTRGKVHRRWKINRTHLEQ